MLKRMGCGTSASVAVPRRRGWLARLALFLGGIFILLVSTALVLLLAVGAAANAWSSFRAWVGMVALAPCLGGGFWCLIYALRGRPPGIGRAPPPRKRELSLRGLVVTIAAAVGLSLIVFALGVRDAGGLERLLLRHPMHLAVAAWYALLFLAALPLVITVHELCHLAAGAVLRFRFAFIQVGPIALAREDGRLTFCWNRPIPDDVLGLQSSMPAGDDALEWRLAIHSAGGPALNFVTAALVWVAIRAAAPTSAPHAALLDACKVAGGASALIGIWNLFPFRTRRGTLSDGGRILYVLRARTDAGLMLLRVGVRYARAQRPHDWNLPATLARVQR
jgi:hypothetical protein